VTEKKILIVTYYWPPSGGSGVQRWLKFVKYLPQFGVTPFVFTPENPSFDLRDESLMKDVPNEAEVIHFPIWEPYDLFNRVGGALGQKGAKSTEVVTVKKGGGFKEVTTWMRGNLIIPDPRVFWVKPSVRFLQDFIRDNEIDTMVTTGPPHSVHLIGYKLKRKNPHLRWLADFRDPWSEWGFLDTLKVSQLGRKMHKRLESKVLQTADIITTITPFYVKRFEQLSGRKVHLLTNGYDESDFQNLAPQPTSKFVIRHVGIVNEKCNPRPFMNALKALVQKEPAFRNNAVVNFTGEVHAAFRDFVESDPLLRAITEFTPTVPHKELIELYNQSSLLLLVLEGYKDAEGYMPGKLFEYLATGLPILGVGPDGDAAELIQTSKAGKMVNADNNAEIGARIQEHYKMWRETGKVSHQVRNAREYSRRTLTENLLAILSGSKG
jgi:Glycosyltransferase